MLGTPPTLVSAVMQKSTLGLDAMGDPTPPPDPTVYRPKLEKGKS